MSGFEKVSIFKIESETKKVEEKLGKKNNSFWCIRFFWTNRKTVTGQRVNQKLFEASKATTQTLDDNTKEIPMITSPNREKPKTITNPDPNLFTTFARSEKVKNILEKKKRKRSGSDWWLNTN